MLTDSLLGDDDLKRQLAEVADGLSATHFELPTLWQALRQGEAEVVFGFCSPERAFLVVRRRSEERGPALRVVPNSKDLDTLERVLRGEPQKVVASEGRLSISTLAVRLGRTLAALGVRGPVSRTPLLLMLTIHSAISGKNFSARSSRFTRAEEEFEVVSAIRPETCLQRLLSNAEYLVARLLLEGSRYDEMSRSRGRSRRTIANQLAATFKKLGVSGRSGILSRAIRQSSCPRECVTGFTAPSSRAPISHRVVDARIQSP